jgi:hypothetical protein
MSITFVRDATHRNINSIPAGMLAALYTTGSVDIKATAADFQRHPNAIRICQDHGSDDTADMLDIEAHAAGPANAPDWVNRARHSFFTNKRPGQRWPGCYMPRSLLTPTANALTAAKLTDVPFWIAHPGMPDGDAIAQINSASGPFPIVGFQIRFETTTDFDIFSTQWINKKSGAIVAVKANVPPGQWKDPKEWEWVDVVTVGIGKDGRLHTFTFNPGTGLWVKVD